MTKTKTQKKNRNVIVSNPFLQALSEKPVQMTVTENGAPSYATTTSAVLDWFSSGGAMRSEDDAKIQAVFAKAFAEDKLLATKVAFYIRDVRGGQGQRKSFRAVLRWLAAKHPNVVRRNIHLIPEYGRWDDVLSLLGTQLETEVIRLVSLQLRADITSAKKEGEISLLAKWMPSANTSSAATRAQAHKLINALGLTPRQYRRALSALRARANVVEREMCARNWSDIDYEKVPSRASMLYRNAFSKHDPAGYSKWKSEVFSGTAKVNAGTLYPYDIVSKLLHGKSDETLELLWRNLPNLLTGQVHKGLVVCDVSGSMTSPTLSKGVRPLDIAVSLAMYFAERCEGPFKDHFITFSGTPQLQKIAGETLADRVQSLIRSEWAMNTNVQAVFELILNRALAAKVKEEDMPEAIYIVSDMQFDCCGHNETSLDAIKAKYVRAGYKMPLLIFWQVRASSDKVALKNEKGVVMVSGFSPNALASILKLEKPQEVTPFELMLATVNSERYEPITA